jgi:succinate-acetate transporter protein
VDERSDTCSLKATRNAFIVALLFLALYMILGQLKPDSLYRIQALQGVFGVMVGAYALSYFYYKSVV